MAAVRFLYKVSNIVITIKFCLEHIIWNVIARYDIPKEKVGTLRKALNGMQSASIYDRFCKKMKMLHTMDLSKSNEIILYMLRIHPRHWTTFGNRSDIPNSRWNDSYEALLRQYMIVTNTVNDRET